MPAKLIWSELRDAVLRRLRSEGATWDTIAAALGISRNAAIERGRRIGARLPRIVAKARSTSWLHDPARESLPPGHEISWAILTAGTSLAGTSYPWPLRHAYECTDTMPQATTLESVR